jgi:hypothetical protein
MDRKALIHLWMMPPSNYFNVPIGDRLEQLKAVVEEKRVQTALMYALLKAQPKKERP